MDALSKDLAPKHCSNVELVNRVKVINLAVLRSKKIDMIGAFGPDLLSLVLYCIMLKDNKLHQIRLLIDHAFMIVDAFESAEDLPRYVEMGAWDKVANNGALKRMLEQLRKVGGD